MKLDLEVYLNNEEAVFYVGGSLELTIRKTLGSKYLKLLSENMNKKFHPIQLRSMVEHNIDIFDVRSISNDDYEYNPLLKLIAFIPASDVKTIREVVQKVKKTDQALDVAKRNKDLAMIECLMSTKESLQQYLSDTITPGGKIKNLSHQSRNDVKSITKAIKRTIGYINAINPEVANTIAKQLTINSRVVELKQY